MIGCQMQRALDKVLSFAEGLGPFSVSVEVCN